MYTLLSLLATIAGLAVSVYAETCTEIDGNWYCQEVEAVTYLNFGAAGTYSRVSYMSDTNGACEFETQSYSGSISPFDEELSIHLRGPLYLKQFAFYLPTASSTSSKRDDEFQDPAADAEAEAMILQARTTSPTCPGSNETSYVVNGKTFLIECGFDRPGDIGMVYTSTFAQCIGNCSTTTSCVDVSYENGGGACYMKGSITTPNYNSIWGARLVSSSSSSSSSKTSSTSSTSKSTSTPTTLTTTTKSSSTSTKTSTTSSTSVSTSSTKSSSSSTLSSSSSTKSSTSSTKASSSTASSTTSTTSSASATSTSTGTWTRSSYYDALSGTSDNLTFLNTMGGGTVSGVWSEYFGNSLSYASDTGAAASSTSQILSNLTMPSSTEIALFTGIECPAENGSCGFYRPGIPAYHGFGGSQKIFLFEFAMPDDASGSNMPAIWFLNALIPRTEQYGSCSCWGNTDGCGELDVFEVLDAGDFRMTSSIHGNQASGDSDYFVRPTGGTIVAAVVLSSEQATIKILNSSFTMGTTLSASQYAALAATTDSYVSGSNASSVTLS